MWNYSDYLTMRKWCTIIFKKKNNSTIINIHIMESCNIYIYIFI